MRFWSFSVKGYYSGLEVTHNVTANTYHPHMHVLLAVDTDYFSTQKYIDRDTWLRHWQSATRDPSITQVDVRAVDMGRTAEGFDTDIMLKSLLECCKYICKPAGLLDPSDMDMTAEVVDTVDRALKGVRLVSFGGAIADARKKLQLEDVEKGDLNSSNANQGEKLNEVAYCWHTGLSQYVPQE
jgi:plasmid rolling circle replication initiator protein Rep